MFPVLGFWAFVLYSDRGYSPAPLSQRPHHICIQAQLVSPVGSPFPFSSFSPVCLHLWSNMSLRCPCHYPVTVHYHTPCVPSGCSSDQPSGAHPRSLNNACPGSDLHTQTLEGLCGQVWGEGWRCRYDLWSIGTWTLVPLGRASRDQCASSWKKAWAFYLFVFLLWAGHLASQCGLCCCQDPVLYC